MHHENDPIFASCKIPEFFENLGLVQSDMLKGNTFQDSTTAKNTSNILLKQKLRAIQRSAGLRKVLPCFEPCRKIAAILPVFTLNNCYFSLVSSTLNVYLFFRLAGEQDILYLGFRRNRCFCP